MTGTSEIITVDLVKQSISTCFSICLFNKSNQIPADFESASSFSLFSISIVMSKNCSNLLKYYFPTLYSTSFDFEIFQLL